MMWDIQHTYAMFMPCLCCVCCLTRSDAVQHVLGCSLFHVPPFLHVPLPALVLAGIIEWIVKVLSPASEVPWTSSSIGHLAVAHMRHRDRRR